MTIKQSLIVINLNTYGELLWTHLNTKVIMHNRALLRACLHGGGGAQPRPQGDFYLALEMGPKPRKRALGTRLGEPQVEEGTHLSG